MKVTKYPWIVVHDGTGKKPFSFECQRCGCLLEPPLPMEVNTFLMAGIAFRGTHEECPETLGGPR